MTFDFSTNGILIPIYDGSDFNESNLTITGAGDITVDKSGGSFTINVATTATGIEATYLRLDGTNGPMTGLFSLSGDPSTALQAATKQYVDAAVVLDVQEDGSPVTDDTATLNFTHALDVASGAGVATVSVDESEFTTVVFLTGNQTVSGNKTFADNVIVQGNFQVDGTTTTLNTEELLVEDNIVTFNSNWTGSAEASGIDAGIEVNRGSDSYAQFLWDETNNFWSAGISGSLERVLRLSDLTAIDADIATVSGLTVTNASGISDNAGDISTNAGNISTNAGGVSTNAGNISTNAGNISTNASDITTLSGYVDSTFVELGGDTMTGLLILSGDPVADLGAATKQYVDASVSGASIAVEDDNVSVNSGVATLNYALGLDVTDDGGGQVSIAVDLTELDAMDLSTAQTASGVKTFQDGIILGVLSAPASGTATGTQGDFRWTDDYLYVATATDTWKRVSISNF